MESETFDLVIIEMFYTEAFIGLGQHFGALVIVVSTFGASQQTYDLVGNPTKKMISLREQSTWLWKLTTKLC